MTDFASLLEKKVEETERATPLPNGSYKVVATRHETGESSKKKTPYTRIFFKIEEPLGDVDLEELKKVKKVTEKERFDDFYMTEDAMFRLREFLEQTLKLRVGGGRTFKDALSEIPGKRAIVVMKQELLENQVKINKVERWISIPK